MGTKSVDLIVQGDVFLVPCKVPEGAKKKQGKTLAYGEATGHHHSVLEDDVTLYEEDGVLYLKAEKEVSVTHQEHKPITVPAGEWRVGIVQEYDPFEEEARNVRD